MVMQAEVISWKEKLLQEIFFAVSDYEGHH